MEYINDFFISHNSKDSAPAKELMQLLGSINPQWRIFLDCSEEHPLEAHEEWRSRMFKEAENSRYLIFIASSPEYLKEGNGWLYEEVSLFKSLKSTRFNRKVTDKNIAYFGIFLCAPDFEKDLYNDPVLGSDYRKLYDRPEHLVLGSDGIAQAAERIKAKVLHLGEAASEELSAELLDKTIRFAREKAVHDPMFCRDAIIPELMPLLRDENKNRYHFASLQELLVTTHLAVLGSEGGSGKTTLLTALFFQALDAAAAAPAEAMIPLYVDCKSLSAKEDMLLRYLAQYLYGEHTAMSDASTGATVGKLSREFSLQRTKPRYLLLLDGYNELSVEARVAFDRQLEYFSPESRYPNVRVVLAGRTVGEALQEELFLRLQLCDLKGSVIADYLKERGLQSRFTPSFFKILSIPMYLRLYVDTATDHRLRTKGELLAEFVKWQQQKETVATLQEEQRSLYRLFFDHVLPLIAHRMLSGATASTFFITPSELEELLAQIPALMGEINYKRFYGSEYRDRLRTSKLLEYDELDLYDLVTEYLAHSCKLLRQNAEDAYEFVHQIYRDFFCALFVSDGIRRTLSERGGPCGDLSGAMLEPDTAEFVVERLQEQKPEFDWEAERWSYACNESSYLIRMLDSVRANGQQGDTVLIANLVALLRQARKDDLSACDFSDLDLRESALQTCVFSRYDTAGVYAACFKNATIDRRNLYPGNHFAPICAACTGKEIMAAVDESGVIMLRPIANVNAYPFKVITGADPSIKVLIFAPDEGSLYAMTAHRILQIPIPDEAFSTARIRVLYETREQLQDIRMDEQGEIYCQTAFNSFNPKPLSDPEQADTVDFAGLNTAAAVHPDGKQLAFGNVAGYYGLKLYNLDETTGEWLEQSIGYSRLLAEYIAALEAELRFFRLYYIFPDDDPSPVKAEDHRRSFFAHLQMQFEDREHDYEQMPDLVIKRILRELRRNDITLFKNQLMRLYGIVNTYRDKIEQLAEQNVGLLLLAGRKICSLSYRKDSHVLLLSAVKKFRKQEISDSLIMELDTQTLATRLITRYTGERHLVARYSGEHIVINGMYRVKIHDARGRKLADAGTRPKNVYGFLQPATEEGYFYTLANHFIYRFDREGRCTNTLDNGFSSYNLCYCVDERGRGYLTRNIKLKETPVGEPIEVLDTTNGVFCKIPNNLTRVARIQSEVSMGEVGFRVSVYKLTRFENERKTAALEIPYKLFVCGCDFTGLKGDLATPYELGQLAGIGALTDDLPPVETEEREHTVDFVPAGESFVPPQVWDGSPFHAHPGISLTLRNLFSEADGGNNLSVIKTWNRIYRGSYMPEGLESADYSILEWINRLGFATADMIYNLVEAGLVARSPNYGSSFESIRNRLDETLHRTYRLLFRYVVNNQGTEGELPIYVISTPFSTVLIRDSINSAPFKLKEYGQVTDAENFGRLILNRWFCQTLRQYKDLVSDYALETIFDTDCHIYGRGRVKGYLCLKNQPIFAQAMRINNNIAVKADKVYRLCLLAENYQQLTCETLLAEPLTRQPVLVLIGESFEQCARLQQDIAQIAPHVRKLYTYDQLLYPEENGLPSNLYFEFDGDTPRLVRLEDVLGE